MSCDWYYDSLGHPMSVVGQKIPHCGVQQRRPTTGSLRVCQGIAKVRNVQCARFYKRSLSDWLKRMKSAAFVLARGLKYRRRHWDALYLCLKKRHVLIRHVYGFGLLETARLAFASWASQGDGHSFRSGCTTSRLDWNS